MESRDFNQVYKTFKSMYESEMKQHCFDALLKILENRDEFHLDHLDDYQLVGALFGLFLTRDKKITKEEKQFVIDIFQGGKYYAAIVDALQKDVYYDVYTWDKIIDHLSIKTKDAVTMLGMCLIACDREINEEEKELFERIYN